MFLMISAIFGTTHTHNVQMQLMASTSLLKHTQTLAAIYFNYMGFRSIVLVAVVETTYRFATADIGSFGWERDGEISAKSCFGR